MKKRINKRGIDALKNDTENEIITDDQIPGFFARRLPSGRVVYRYIYRIHGLQQTISLGVDGAVTPDLARKLAKKYAGEVVMGRNPLTERRAARARERSTLSLICDDWLKQAVRGRLRTARAIERLVDNHIKPALGSMSILGIKRSDVVRMLDRIAEESGEPMADRVLTWLGRIFNWYAIRCEQFRTPLVRGMRRTSTKERARTRTLSDAELIALWRATADGGAHDAFIRFSLLTACRRTEAGAMHRREIDGSNWIIPESRYKTNYSLLVPLSDAALAILAARLQEGYLFGSQGRPLGSFSRHKVALDRRMLDELRKADPKAELAPWCVHDLRRTARSLMSRAGVSSDHAERVLGHIVTGIRGIYDLYQYADEKRDAVTRLAGLVERIAEGPSRNNIIALKA
jgi:integrase